MPLKFLIDECAPVKLVQIAQDRAFVAYHVAHRGLAGRQDHELMPVLLSEELVLVTNNGRDFKALLGQKEAVHPGLVVFATRVRAAVQAILFRSVLDHIGQRTELINRLIEVDVDDRTKARLSGNECLSEEVWEEIARTVEPQIREDDLPEAT